MIRLSTALGAHYLRSADVVESISAPKAGNKLYPEPTRVLVLNSGQKVYVSDTEENMRLLVGDDYAPDVIAPPAKRAKKTKKVEE